MNDEINVIISFDTEFSINGAFANPQKCKPSSHEIFEPNSSGSEGLQDVLNILRTHFAQATFFVEALNTHYFGSEKMGRYVTQILDHGQDVQLHTHPCWLAFKDPNWQNSVKGKNIVDSFLDMSVAEIVEILKPATDILSQWTKQTPSAFRAGNLHACTALYQALEQLDIKLASNIGIPIFKPKEPELQIENTPSCISNTVEIPITTYQSMGHRHKALTITGTSFKETKEVLTKCKSLGIRHVIILTHVHEFIKINRDESKIKANKVNLNRLNSLCEFVNDNKRFKFNTFGQLASVSTEQLVNRQSEMLTESAIHTSRASGMWTIIENQLNDRVWYY